MKFDEFKKLREKAIEINGLDESADLIEYKDSIHEASEAVNEMEDIGDFFFGHLKAMKSLAILIARYPMTAKKKTKIELKAYEKVKTVELKGEKAKEVQRDKLKEVWKLKIEKLPQEKHAAAREIAKKNIDQKMSFFDQRIKAEVSKVNSKSRDDINQVSAKWDRIQGRNELPRKVWNDRWNAAKARIDGNAEADLIEGKIAIEEKYSDGENGSIDKQIERFQKKAKEEKEEAEEKAKEAEEKAKAEEKEQFDKLDDEAKEVFLEMQPILNDFINSTSKYEAATAEVISTFKEINLEKDDYKKMDDEEKESNKDDHKQTLSKLEEELKTYKEEVKEHKKTANTSKDELKSKRDAAEKAGLWPAVQKQIDTFSAKQEDYRNSLELQGDSVEPEENSGESEDSTKEEKVTRAKEELNKHQTDVLDKYKDDLDIATSADEPDKNKISELETQVLQAEIQKSKLQYTLTKLEDEEGVNDKLKEISDKINDLTDELQAKKSKGGEDEEGGSDNQKKKETDQKREELKNKIESGESKVAELKDKDPDKAAKIQKNIDNLKDKLEALDKDPNESANFGILDKLHEAMDLILLELNNSLQAKTKFAEFLEMKKNK